TNFVSTGNASGGVFTFNGGLTTPTCTAVGGGTLAGCTISNGTATFTYGAVFSCTNAGANANTAKLYTGTAATGTATATANATVTVTTLPIKTTQPATFTYQQKYGPFTNCGSAVVQNVADLLNTSGTATLATSNTVNVTLNVTGCGTVTPPTAVPVIVCGI